MKGYIYTLEVLLAVSIIVGSLFLIMGNMKSSQDYQPSPMVHQVFDALRYIDTKGDLRIHVIMNNSEWIKHNLTSLLPETINLDVAICSAQCTSTYTPSDRTVIALDYFIAGYRDVYIGKRVHVWVWEKY